MDVSGLGAVQSVGTNICGSDGCNYTATAATSGPFLVASMGHGAVGTIQTVTSVGTTCSATTAQASPGQQQTSGQASTTCDSQGGNIACLTQDASGHNCGTYNGDQVCVATVPQGQCAQYASGGVMCVQQGSSETSPPAPNNGSSATTPATPTETVTAPAGSGATTTANYYSAATVAGSTKGTTVTATGTTGNPTGGAAVGAGGSGTNPADCDTTANASGCTGTTPTAQTPECSAYAACFETFWSEAQPAPIFAAVTALETAWPSGSCPAETVTLGAEMDNKSLDYGTPMCNLWENSAVPILSSCTLVLFALAAIRIVLSA